MLPIDTIRRTLSKLADREWPENWGPRAREEVGDFYGWTHRYRLSACLSETDVNTFEAQNGIVLPGEYRTFVLQLGNGGAGPYYGIFPLGSDEDGRLSPNVLRGLREGLSHSEILDGSARRRQSALVVSERDETRDPNDMTIPGALPLSTEGCAIDYWLVVSGPARGQILCDRRAEGGAIKPVFDQRGKPITFGAWYMKWLTESRGDLDRKTTRLGGSR